MEQCSYNARLAKKYFDILLGFSWKYKMCLFVYFNHKLPGSLNIVHGTEPFDFKCFLPWYLLFWRRYIEDIYYVLYYDTMYLASFSKSSPKNSNLVILKLKRKRNNKSTYVTFFKKHLQTKEIQGDSDRLFPKRLRGKTSQQKRKKSQGR